MWLAHKFRKWQRALSTYAPIVRVDISRSALLHNYNFYKNLLTDIAVAPVLKSNAYGHGLVEVAEILQDTDAPFFVVDSLYEAKQLRHAGVKKSLLIIGYVTPEQIVHNSLRNVAFTITDINQLRDVCKLVKSKLVLHIKFDTGMHRQGLELSQLNEAVALLKSHKLLQVEGICTHLCDADGKDSLITDLQLQSWQTILTEWEKNYGRVTWRHLSATHGVRMVNSQNSNLIRLGIGLYGVDSSGFEQDKLRPVLAMRTVIGSLRTVVPGDHVGYNATYTFEHNRIIATIPVGYYEGVDRRLSNHGSVIVDGIECPIVGRVSMNITSIDVTEVKDCKVGDEVVVIGNISKLNNSVMQMAKLAETIPYEIIVHIPSHLRRTIID